jgi:glutamyl-tRNA synthetase
MATGRFAPSPTGDLHLGNLRTALVAWLFARSAGSAFLVRMEDLDRAQAGPEHEASQLGDLAALGLDWDGEVVRQSDRFDRYVAAIAALEDRGFTYPCYCTRREVREAAAAPHRGPMPEGAYPGTCRELTAAHRSERRAAGRPPALRLRADVGEVTVGDDLLGPITAAVDDLVLRRNDGVPAYNLAVVVDDAAQGVEQVVRGDDLATSAPRQRYLADLLGLSGVAYAHVPLVLAPSGDRLAKRHGAVTLADLAGRGVATSAVVGALATSLGLAEPGESVAAAELVSRFAPHRLAREPWTVGTELLCGPGLDQD